jgi:poly-beta-1,6-N-acetyl-D-glucosamine N-deacetylase
MKRLRLRRWHVLLFAMIVVMLISFGISHFKSGNMPQQSLTEPASAEAQQVPSATNDAGPDHPQQIEKKQPVYVQPSKIYYQNKVAVITYHHLDAVESSVTITPDRFKSHLEALKNNGFQVISVEDFVDFLQKKKTVPPNAVVITFDDGYESVYKYAYPILKSEGMTATVFLIVSYIEDGTVRIPPIMNWNEIMEMHKDGFSFYSHTFNSHETIAGKKGEELSKLTTKIYNPSVNRLETDSEYKSRIQSDLTEADHILNTKLGNKINLLCLPHGKYNQDVINIANQSQISYLFTGVEGLNTDSIKLIKRINTGSPYMSDKLLIKKLTQSK